MTNLTRRNFVKGAAVAGSAATMLSMAACGGSDSSTTDGGEKKKVLRFGQSNAKLGLDMQKSTMASPCTAPSRRASSATTAPR